MGQLLVWWHNATWKSCIFKTTNIFSHTIKYDDMRENISGFEIATFSNLIDISSYY